ncbi:MAG: hypothetical protein ABS35_36315 [Kaistia sp. SCN 65-12]|nr:MAG: hypothetical protein ABS35_36315 [Kaistia sp. SCN 65-12]
MITPRTLSDRLAAARLAALPEAMAGTLRPLFPDVTVRTHPGRIDVADVVAGEIFQPPMIAVSVIGAAGPVQVPGQYNIVAECAAYVVTEETVIAGRSTRREEVALALCHGLLDILADFMTPRWGLSDITSPADMRAQPLFTALSYQKGVCFYAVTWRQTLFAEGQPMTPPMPTERLETVQDGEITKLWPTEDAA